MEHPQPLKRRCSVRCAEKARAERVIRIVFRAHQEYSSLCRAKSRAAAVYAQQTDNASAASIITKLYFQNKGTNDSLPRPRSRLRPCPQVSTLPALRQLIPLYPSPSRPVRRHALRAQTGWSSSLLWRRRDANYVTPPSRHGDVTGRRDDTTRWEQPHQCRSITRAGTSGN